MLSLHLENMILCRFLFCSMVEDRNGISLVISGTNMVRTVSNVHDEANPTILSMRKAL